MTGKYADDETGDLRSVILLIAGWISSCIASGHVWAAENEVQTASC